jgi:DNA-binding transcriptional MerR regulator
MANKKGNQRYYSDALIDMIEELKKTKSLSQIAKQLNLPYPTVEYLSRVYTPSKPRDVREYTQAEKDFIYKNYATMTAKEIGLKINRSKRSVYQFIYRNAIYKGDLQNV